jgi:hypothetical protein
VGVNQQQDNLFKALGIFIESMRGYIVRKLKTKKGKKWFEWYYESLYPAQQDPWIEEMKKGRELESLIDYGNLKGFSLCFKEFLRDDFDRKVNNLPTWFDELAEVRNKCQHYQPVDDFESERAYGNIIQIFRILNFEEELEAITALKENKDLPVSGTDIETGKLLPWFKNVVPHIDIQKNQLDESVFAANLSEVAEGNGREIYLNPVVFFSKTYFTEGLKTVARRMISGLNGGEEAENRVISLQTGFGGGKTHTLISLYHLAKAGKDKINSAIIEELYQTIGYPKFQQANVSVFTNTTNDPVQGREIEGINIRTLWGEIAWQLGGKKAYDIIRENDQQQTAPKGLFIKVLELCKPALILVDELADYCISASGVEVGASTLSDQTISFIQELSESIARTDQCMLIATLPASVVEVGNSQRAADILTSLTSRLGRIGADTKPVADEEIFDVIRRRLFENLGDDNIRQQVVSEYMQYYQELMDELPGEAIGQQYKELMLRSYPFHPELINIFRKRWAANHDFQRTRGVLRLLASIVSDLWKRQNSLLNGNLLIHPSDVRFQNLDALCGQLKKLYGNGYDAVLQSDISGINSNSAKIDQDRPEYGNVELTQGIASCLMLSGFGGEGYNKGLNIKEIKLDVLKPRGINHNSINGALDSMEERAHYLHYAAAGSGIKRYWFFTEPNLNIIINQARTDIKQEAINAEIIKRLYKFAEKFEQFKPLVAPDQDIPEQKNLTVIITHPEYLANPQKLSSNIKKYISKIATKKGNSERIYKNTILFMVCTEAGKSHINSDIRDYLACQKVNSEFRNQLDQTKKTDLKKKIEECSIDADKSIASGYSLIIKQLNTECKILILKQFKDNLAAQFNSNVLHLLREEEWLIDGIGLNLLRKNNLLPQKTIPVKVKDLYEAFLRFDDKPMISSKSVVEKSLKRYCLNGVLCIAAGNGKEFTNYFYKEDIPYFDVEDTSYWLLDKTEYKAKDIPDSVDDKPEEKPSDDEDQDVNTNKGHKTFKSVKISGKVSVDNYSQIFTSFIVPLKDNRVEIEISIKGKNTEANPLTENSKTYKIIKESASQLGLKLEKEN